MTTQAELSTAQRIVRDSPTSTARPWVDLSGVYRFHVFVTGIMQTARVCPELDAVITQKRDAEVYRVLVGRKLLDQRFLKPATAIKAAIAEAKAQGIV